MLNIAICDDEEIIAEQIESFLLEIQNNITVKMEIDVFYSSDELITSLNNEVYYDLIYLDIKMPQKNGIEVAHIVREFNYKTLLIFVSGYESYWKQLFEVETFRFITKPIDKQLFQNYFYAALDRIRVDDMYFDFTYKHRSYKISLFDIIYFESDTRYIIIHLINGNTKKFRGKLNDIEIKLINNKANFMRIHQSYLVNFRHIQSMSRSQVKMVNEVILPISYENQKTIRIQFANLLGGSND